jgi:hypothetical protein
MVRSPVAINRVGAVVFIVLQRLGVEMHRLGSVTASLYDSDHSPSGCCDSPAEWMDRTDRSVCNA